MIVERGKEGFEPFTLNLTFETRDEAERFYAVFNHTDVCEFTGFGTSLRELIGKEYYSVSPFNSFRDKIR